MARNNSGPVRKCVVCGARGSKARLVRMALDDKFEIVPDLAQRLPGRGAYVCAGCIPRLKRNGVVQRAFRSRAKGMSLEKFEGLSAQ